MLGLVLTGDKNKNTKTKLHAEPNLLEPQGGKREKGVGLVCFICCFGHSLDQLAKAGLNYATKDDLNF